MYYFLKGKVELIKQSSIILSNNNIGYQILVSHPEDYKLNTEILIYLYNVVKEDCNYLIGFTSLDEKYLFLSLIKVNGLGPKTAITMLSKSRPNEIKQAIQSNNIAFLKRLPGIGEKAAYQIILDINKNTIDPESGVKQYTKVMDALKSLGFKKATIERALASINDPSLSEEALIKKALILLKKWAEF